MRLDRQQRIQVGQLGRFHFNTGTYVYVGSAWGPGGLAARIGRHLRSLKKCRWHIDYLRRHARIKEIWVGCYRPNVEHLWAGIFADLTGGAVPAENFGSSDCRCSAHLFYLPDTLSVQRFNRAVNRRLPGNPRAHIWSVIN